MANQSKLKAWVRYDGTNTVVTAGPIFRASKPKVGNWRQINADLCCNGSITTTTTTTNGGGGVTPTAWAGFLSNSGQSNLWAWNACNGVNGGSIIVYTSTSVSPLPAGTALYSDAALTTLIPYSFGAIAINGLVYEIQNGQTNPLGGSGVPCEFITTTTSTTSGIQAYSVRVSTSSVGTLPGACGQGLDISGNFWTDTYDPAAVTKFYYDQALTQPYQGNVNDYYAYMFGWPSGTLWVGTMNSGGTITNNTTCI